MARTYRTARGQDFASPVAAAHSVKERNHRPWAKAWKKTLHHRERRQATRFIAGQLQEVIA